MNGIDLEWEAYALQQEANQVAAWVAKGRPEAEIQAYLKATGYQKRLAAYKKATRGS